MDERNPEWLTHEEAAEYLRKTPRALHQANYLGRGPKRHKVGGRLLYRAADLREFIESRAVA